MSFQLRFDGRVTIVTGAGSGLGKAYAIWFAERGSSVVVNDLGGSSNGEGASKKSADLVVEEIQAKGGRAVADYNSVEHGERIVQTAIDTYGRIDILVNNAGILRDKTLANTSNKDWDLIHQIHLRGPFVTIRAAWPHFRRQNYGRIIVTSSSSGIYGNFGQGNYSSAKMGLIGLSKTIGIEGKKFNIHCNTIVPSAASRLTQGMFPAELAEQLRPELIAPVVLWLCHESCVENGSVIDSGCGWVGKYRFERSRGVTLRQSTVDSISPEVVRDFWQEIVNFTDATHPESISESSTEMLHVVQDLLRKDAERNNDHLSPVDQALSWSPPQVTVKVDPREIIWYALSVGASTGDPSQSPGS